MSNRDRQRCGVRRLRAAIAMGLIVGALPGCSAELIDAFIRGIVVPAPVKPSVLVIGLPMGEARAFVAGRPVVVGLGVYPESRRSEEFFEQAWSGSPDPGDAPRLGARSPVRRALSSAGRSVGIFVDPATAGNPIARLGEAGMAEDAASRANTVEAALRADFTVLVLPTQREAERVAARAPNAVTYVLGAGARSPVLVARVLQPNLPRRVGEGVLTGGIARRRGIVTPYDLAATLLASGGARSSGVVGEHLLVDPSERPLGVVDELAARLERDDDFGPGLSIAIVALGIASVVLGTAGLLAGRGTVAEAFVRGASLLPIGYVIGLFVPDGRWQVRVVPMLVIFVLGLLVPIRPAGRFAGRVLLATTAGIAVLTIAAAANPDGEPALSLWGNPLVSWRFFGLRNHLVAFMTGGLLAASAMLATPTALVVAAGIAAGAVAGAPWLGANFVGVLTLGFGVAIASLGRKTGRVLLRHFPIATAVGIVATFLALLADSGSPVSHGGRALDSVRSEGLARAWEIFRERARLNYGEVADLGFIGFLGLALAAAALGMLLWWAIRSEKASIQARAGVGGAAAAGLAALLLEDSGFFTGGIIGFFAWIAFAAALTVVRGASLAAPFVSAAPERLDGDIGEKPGHPRS